VDKYKTYYHEGIYVHDYFYSSRMYVI
jgi:hypothetical protein